MKNENPRSSAPRSKTIRAEGRPSGGGRRQRHGVEFGVTRLPRLVEPERELPDRIAVQIFFIERRTSVFLALESCSHGRHLTSIARSEFAAGMPVRIASIVACDRAKGKPSSGDAPRKMDVPKSRYEVFDETTYRRYDVVLRNAVHLVRSRSSGVRIRAVSLMEREESGSRGAREAMHIPDSVLDTKVIVTTMAVGAVGLAIAVRKIERRLGDRTTVLMGTMAAFVFAAQMVNFPVGPLVSGHLLGGVLASVLLGPWAGAVVIAAVLLVQCFLFADGGVTALGANFVNMGLIGAVGGYAIYAPIRRMIGGQKGVLIAAMSAAWFSVLLSSGACALELAASGHGGDFPRLLAWMALVHAVIGLGEALITGAAVRFPPAAPARSLRNLGCRCPAAPPGRELGPGAPGWSGSRPGCRRLPRTVCL